MQNIHFIQGLPYPEARKLADARFATQKASYASVASSGAIKTCTSATQTDLTWPEHTKSPIQYEKVIRQIQPSTSQRTIATETSSKLPQPKSKQQQQILSHQQQEQQQKHQQQQKQPTQQQRQRSRNRTERGKDPSHNKTDQKQKDEIKIVAVGRFDPLVSMETEDDEGDISSQNRPPD